MLQKTKETIMKGFIFGVSMALGAGLTGLTAITIADRIAYTNGELLTAEKLNSNFETLFDAVDSLPDCNVQKVKLKSNLSYTLGPTSNPSLHFNQETFDPNNMHDNVNQDRITIQQNGLYLVVTSAKFGGMHGFQTLNLWKNNGEILRTNRQHSDGESGVTLGNTVTTLAQLNAGDYLTLSAQIQNSVHASNPNATTAAYPEEFSVTRICGD